MGLPDDVMSLINDPNAQKVLGTKSAKGDVHLINVGGSGALDPETIFVGEVFMKVSDQNLQDAMRDGSLVSLLVTKGFKSYEIKSKVRSHETSGPLFEKMHQTFSAMKFDLKGIWLLQPQEVWNQSPTYDAGKRIV